MHQAEHKTGFGTWLRHAWDALICALESMDRSPMEDVSGRLERLEREVATLKNARD
jgi:polyhydroxyalkanoate synthesis regulator phasin